MNSDPSAGSFSIPIPSGVTVTNVGFHDVDYHSGEPWDGTDWSVSLGGGTVAWSTLDTFANNEFENALAGFAPWRVTERLHEARTILI